jgi:ketosteroid isomerase-like protein
MTSGVVSRQRGDRIDVRSRMPTSTNKDTVERYLDGFRRMDHPQILGCLTDDITWTVICERRAWVVVLNGDDVR